MSGKSKNQRLGLLGTVGGGFWQICVRWEKVRMLGLWSLWQTLYKTTLEYKQKWRKMSDLGMHWKKGREAQTV